MRAVFLAALALLALACTDAVEPPVGGGAGGVPSGGAGGSGGSSNSSSSTGGIQLSATFTIRGVVRDQDGAPLEGAYVLQGGRSHEPTETTAADGSYRITMQYAGLGIPTVVAGKIRLPRGRRRDLPRARRSRGHHPVCGRAARQRGLRLRRAGARRRSHHRLLRPLPRDLCRRIPELEARRGGQGSPRAAPVRGG